MQVLPGRRGRHRVGRILVLPDRVEHLARILVLELDFGHGCTGRNAEHDQRRRHNFQLRHRLLHCLSRTQVARFHSPPRALQSIYLTVTRRDSIIL
jgi:hypothetical protein